MMLQPDCRVCQVLAKVAMGSTLGAVVLETCDHLYKARMHSACFQGKVTDLRVSEVVFASPFAGGSIRSVPDDLLMSLLTLLSQGCFSDVTSRAPPISNLPHVSCSGSFVIS